MHPLIPMPWTRMLKGEGIGRAALARRFFIAAIILLQAPLGYNKAPREPIAPIQALAQFTIVGRREDHKRIVEAGKVPNATVVEHLVAMATLPGILIRMNASTWNVTSLRNVTSLAEKGMLLSTRRMEWWEGVENKRLLKTASYACVIGTFLPFSRRRNTVHAHAHVYAEHPQDASSAPWSPSHPHPIHSRPAPQILNMVFFMGLLLFALVFATYAYTPTIQYVAALTASIFELRNGLLAEPVDLEPAAADATSAAATATVAGGKKSKTKKAKKTD